MQEPSDPAARRLLALTEVAAALSLRTSLSEALDKVCLVLAQSCSAAAATVHVLARENLGRSFTVAYGAPPEYDAQVRAAWRAGGRSPVLQQMHDDQVTVLEDLPTVLRRQPALRPLAELVAEAGWDTMASAPMGYLNRGQGSINVLYRAGTFPAPEDLTMIRVVAAQAAVVVENDRLLQLERNSAADAERQRLSRELHDSVTQALFSLTVQAKAAELSLQRTLAHSRTQHNGEDATAAGDAKSATGLSSSQLLESLTHVRTLAGTALAEMRELIVQMRPSAIAEDGLTVALTKHAATIMAREHVDVVVTETGAPRPLPADTAQHLYRACMEAITNAVRHAKTDRVDVSLSWEPTSLHIDIEDHGRGFDPDTIPTDHFGLSTMRERAAHIEAALTIASTPGKGTTVHLDVPTHVS